MFDVKGTAAVQTGDLRRRYGDVKIICPYPVHRLRSDKFSPLALLDPGSKYFYADARAVIDAIVDIEDGENAHWSESAADFGAALIMWECILARREKRPTALLNVRLRGTEPDRWEPDPANPRRQRLAAGLRLTAARMIEEGGPIIASLVAPFLREHGGEDELASIQSFSAEHGVPSGSLYRRLGVIIGYFVSEPEPTPEEARLTARANAERSDAMELETGAAEERSGARRRQPGIDHHRHTFSPKNRPGRIWSMSATPV